MLVFITFPRGNSSTNVTDPDVSFVVLSAWLNPGLLPLFPSKLFQTPDRFISSEMLMSELAQGIVMTFPLAKGTSIPSVVYL